MAKTNKLSTYFLLALALLIGVEVFRIFVPFIATLILAFIFWNIFNPIFTFFEKKFKNARVASLFTCVLVFLVIIIPFFVVGSIAAEEAVGFYKNVTRNSSAILELQNSTKNLGSNLYQKLRISPEELGISFDNLNFADAAKKSAGVTAELLQQAFQQVTQFVFLVFVMLFTLYFLFLDGNKLIKYIFRISPLSNSDETLIWNRFLSMSRATIKGTLIIGVIQGMIGWLSFWAAGIDSSIVWGVVIGILSVIPFLGLIVVWLPAAIWFILAGAWIKAIILFFIGLVIIGLVDNFLKPRLIGTDTLLHPVLILIGTFGGIVEFGIMGFIIGPLILTIFMTILEIFEKNYSIRNSNR